MLQLPKQNKFIWLLTPLLAASFSPGLGAERNAGYALIRLLIGHQKKNRRNSSSCRFNRQK